MNAITAMSYDFLLGKKLSIRTAFKDFSVTNLPREASRSIEKKFGVRLVRVRKDGKTKYGVPCTWFEYHLLDNSENRSGRIAMKEYIKSQIGNPRTERENKITKMITLL